MKLRINKYLATCGVASRRKAESLVLERRVKVNSDVITSLSQIVDTTQDIVTLDQKIVSLDSFDPIYLLMNKPRGVITSASDPQGRETVLDLCKEISSRYRLFPVGRLDYLSEGLLLLTNDGELAQEVIHPKNKIIKRYEVKVFGIVNADLLEKLRAGIRDNKQFLKAYQINILKYLNNKTWLEFQIMEGKNRQIRRMCSQFNLTIDKLKRISIGNLHIQGVAPGKYRFLEKKEILSSIKLGSVASEIEVPHKRYLRKGSTVRKNQLSANSDKFYKYRKSYYQQTMKWFKDKTQKEQEQLQAQLLEKRPKRKSKVQKSRS